MINVTTKHLLFHAVTHICKTYTDSERKYCQNGCNVVKKHQTNETPIEMPLKEQISTEKTETSIESDV